MQKIRSFVALPMEAAARRRIERLASKLGEEFDGIRWVPDKNLHMTLAFLGDVDASQISSFCDAVGEAVGQHEPFEISLYGLGAFPNLDRPRVIWIGFREGVERTIALQEDVARRLCPLGYCREPRPFVPHLTIGRVRRGKKLQGNFREKIEQLTDWECASSEVSEIHVMSSQLSRQDGAQYAILSTHSLGE